jgi:hypothetical protein
VSRCVFLNRTKGRGRIPATPAGIRQEKSLVTCARSPNQTFAFQFTLPDRATCEPRVSYDGMTTVSSRIERKACLPLWRHARACVGIISVHWRSFSGDSDTVVRKITPKLLDIATKTRCALERYSRSTKDLTFKDFPRGSCGLTAELLGRYLIQCGYSNVMYVRGQRGPNLSHAWLQG